MQNLIQKNAKIMKRFVKKLTVWAVLAAMIVQMLAVCGFAVPIGELSALGSLNGSSSSSGTVDGIGKIEDSALIDSLKKDYLAYIKKDLLMKIEDYELSGEVEVVLTFSDDSIIESYLSSSERSKKTFSEYRASAAALAVEKDIIKNQNAVLELLWDKELISEVYHTYTNILDGAFVRTTYEQLEAICALDSVQRVTISNTYKAMAAVENPVNVYDTGIFNSGNVSYTGKGTVVAVLDTGCDYTHTAFTSHTVESPKYDRDDIEGFLPFLRANAYGEPLEPREVYYGNITGGKIVYGYDYADKDPDIMPYSNSHGTHVAGIIGGKDDKITGVAVDTQFAIMKVFSDYEEGAKDGDIIAALEDSVVLQVDAINMSLGSSCGFTIERDADDVYKNELYQRIEDAGISLIVAASNDYSSAFGGEQGNTNKTDNPDSATVGSPSTYIPSMSVASINGNKDYYMFANGEKTVFFTESFDLATNEYDFFEMLNIKEGETVTYEYVTVPGFGLAINYSGIDVKGKIALVKRGGDVTFEEKVQYAQEAGAIAVIIYNNIFGNITMTIGNYAKIPAVSIGKDDGDILASRESGTIVFDRSNVAGPFMSDFSSWGPAPDLTLKPDITAHGGNITSAVIGGYDELSGTSMAAPNMCGITVLIRQYVKDKYPKLSTVEVRDLVYQLCMSTATIALDKNGNPYSPRKQGAGIADIVKSTTTEAYLHVDGLNKTKIELGADPKRAGVYTLPINLTNLSETAAVSYKLGHITMTESVSTSDPEFVAEMAYLLGATAEYAVEGGKLENGVVTVEPGKTAKITVTITLTKEDKSYLNSLFENGMFVEGFLTFDNTDENGVDLNAPFLAFYGDWGEAPIFDIDYYEVQTEAHNDAIDDDDKIKADYYATTPLASYYYDYILPLGSYLYKMDEDEYAPIPATREHAAISYYDQSLSGIYGTFVGLLRNARELRVTMVNTTTGEVVYDVTEYNCYKAHYAGAPRPYASRIDMKTANFDTNEILGWNNNKFEVTLTAKLDWDSGENISDTYSYSFYIDYEAPTIVDSTFRTEYDKSREENRYYLDLMIYDNHYAMSCRPVTVYEMYFEDDDEIKRTTASLSEYPIPVYQENRGETTKVTMEITDYLDIIAESDMPSGISIYVDDYALNSSLFYIPFPDTDDEDIEFLESEMDLDIHGTFDLSNYFVRKDTTETIKSDFLKTLKWSSSDESVVTVKNGKIEALKQGSAVISATSDSWTIKEVVDGEIVKTPVYKSIVINVSDKVISDNPDSGQNIAIEDLTFAYYNTLFAFNNDIDYSAIGQTGSINYFGGNYSIEFYPSEQIELVPLLKPWNISKDRYEFIWSSSNPNVATVDQDGVVTAEAEGKARITLQIKIDGKTSLLAARLSVEVKSEFIIENRTLVAYKGKGGDVVIPDDEGIMKIGSYAFSHFFLDNEKYVEKDENGYYDIDEKKRPLGNDTITSVVIPENVDTIEKYAFYNCSKLTKVTLPESCETINESAFENCKALESVNFKDVNIISDRAFFGCESLTCSDLGGVDLTGVYTIGDYAFSETALEKVTLTYLSRVGVGIFAECKSLTTVELGKRTRISVKMFENSAVEEIVIYSDMVSDSAFEGCEKLTSVVFKNDLTYLGDSAFKDCVKLSSVKFEGGVEQIAGFAFYNCDSLNTFTLPDCKLSLGNAVFGDSGVNKIVFEKNTELTSIGGGLFDKVNAVEADLSKSDNYKLSGNVIYTNDGKTLLLALPARNFSTFKVPANVENIGDGAFSPVSTIVSVTFESGSSLKNIGKYAFANCSMLLTVSLPQNSISIGDYAFYYTTALKTVDLSNVTNVGNSAFEASNINEANLTADGVKIGDRAFYGCSKLKKVSLGKDAYVGNFAFFASTVSTVDLEGDAIISNYAFAGCGNLTSFDFADITGSLGDSAFYGCVNLTAVVAPKLKEIGAATFANCSRLEVLDAAELKVIGDKAFAPLGEQNVKANSLKTLKLPSLETIGEFAFAGSFSLESAEMPKLISMGNSAFMYCEKLTSIIYSKELKEIPESAFYLCLELSDIDISNIVTVGDTAFCGVKLPSNLVLENVESIGKMAFVELNDRHYIEAITAPKLVYIGEQAFAGCTNLKTVYAPSLEEIADLAFYSTAIEEFEIFPSFKAIGTSVFEGCEKFKAFFSTVNGEKKYDAVYKTVMVHDGVLYLVKNFGYSLVCYPRFKANTEYSVAEGTARIEFGALNGNKNLEKVTLPASMRTIGNFSFYECENLKTVVFKSYYAPVLEGTLNGSAVEINPSTIENYPGFDKLYKYEYYYAIEGVVYRPFYYRNFVGTIGSNEVPEITAIIPDNCEGYDSMIYNAYFTLSEEKSGVTMGKYAIAFIDSVKKLPEVVDRFDKLLVDEAIVAFNALEGHADEKVYVSDDIYAKFNSARTEYNVHNTIWKIDHIFDVFNTKHSFDTVKDARATFMALTEEEKAMITNSELLTKSIADLEAALGCKVDFSLTYEDHLPKSEDPTVGDTTTAVTDVTGNGASKVVIIIVVAIAVVVVALVAVGAIMFIKKKNTASKTADGENAESKEEAAASDGSENETENTSDDAVEENEKASDEEASDKEED